MLSIILEKERSQHWEAKHEHKDAPSRVTNPEAPRLDTTNSGRANDQDALGIGLPQDLPRVPLRDTLGNQSDRLDLLVLQALKGTRVHRARRGKVDNDVNIRVLRHGLLQPSVDRQKGLLRSPVELLDVVSTEGVNHGSDGRRLASTRVVKVEHALDGTGLETVDERAGLSIEGPEPRTAGLRLRLELDDVVRGLRALAIRVDRADGLVGVSHRRNLLDLGRGARGLDALEATGGGVGGLALGEVNAECEGDDLGDVGVGAEDTDRDTEGLAKEAHGLETLLVVGTATTNEDLDLMSNELVLVLLEGADDSLEGRSDVGEVGDTTTNDENLAIGTGSAAGEEVDYQECQCTELRLSLKHVLMVFAYS